VREIQFEWDPSKASANARKRGVTFEEARTVFEDDEALGSLIPITILMRRDGSCSE
jgi:hypothetical protein